MPKPLISTARRREVRKSVPRRSSAMAAAARDRRVMWAVLFVLLLAAGSLAVLQWPGDEGFHYPNQVLEKPIVSRVEFQYENIEETRILRDQAERACYNVYIANEAYLEELDLKLESLLSSRNEMSEQDLPVRAKRKLDSYVENSKPIMQWEQDKREFLIKMFELVILRAPRFNIERELGSMLLITVIPPERFVEVLPEHLSSPSDFFSVEDVETMARNVVFAARAFHDEALEKVVVQMVMKEGEAQPTYLFNKQLTDERKDLARNAVQPVTYRHKAQEVLIPAGKTLDDQDMDLIRMEQREYQQSTPLTARLARTGGTLAMLLLIASGLWMYVFAYQHRVTRNAMRGLAVTLLLLLAEALAVGLALMKQNQTFFYAVTVFPPLMVTMVLAIAYDQRFALAVGSACCGLVAIALGQSAAFALIPLSGVGIAVAMLAEVRTISKLVRVGLACGLMMGIATICVSMATRPLTLEGALPRILWDGFCAVLGGLGAALLVQAVLPAIERLFKVTTAMHLRELTDVTLPLLQRLAQEAPGTYQHSLRIADMAEAAAEAIGADGLLCRVGALYHDIGKTNKPLYFIENQGGGPNRHAKLSPAMSLLIIVGHVKDGIEMAREYKLPPEVRHFIESHHGTTLVEYFYHAARKQKEAEDQGAPSEFEFRYPGPKPQTREAAIMLLADSVEAAARVISEPTPIRIEQLVDKMANKRLMDGQFDECNLTLSELHLIQQSITKMLCAIHHARIKYPGEKPSEPKPQPQPQAPQPQTQSA
ncbi:MAG: HDIG domain-containing protein [Phycisphaeraceae bacterium]|nr:HDIG domain-containing protein [Phycisphaeraceae bacterium]